MKYIQIYPPLYHPQLHSGCNDIIIVIIMVQRWGQPKLVPSTSAF